MLCYIYIIGMIVYEYDSTIELLNILTNTVDTVHVMYLLYIYCNNSSCDAIYMSQTWKLGCGIDELVCV